MNGQLNWFKGGLLLGAAFLFAVALVKPIGVSTQFVIARRHYLEPSFQTLSSRKTLKVRQAIPVQTPIWIKVMVNTRKTCANPLNYSFIFVLAMIAGAFISFQIGRPQP